ncbi:MAG: preprotein translocase subunit SecE [Clostridia bacterium]|nr:preprotein translocase subunit SecE [Clostridia bacterium]
MAENKEKKPGRIAKFFRDYKSELKKITWCPFKTVKSNTVLVCVTVVILAVIIGLLDLGTNTGLIEFGKLFG